MTGKTGIKVFAPASIGNFGAGMNIMSAAVEGLGDEIIAFFDDSVSGVQIEQLTGKKQFISSESSQNSACIAGQLLLDHLDYVGTGIKLKIHKGIPAHSGFSSNASSAVAGVFAVNELLGRPLERYDLIGYAEKAANRFNIHPFPAQVASILFGGILLYRDIEKESFQKIYCPTGIQLTLILPEVHYEEREKLQFIETTMDHQKNIHISGNTASMISSLYTSDFDLFGACLQEKLPEMKMRTHYPYFEPMYAICLEEGAYGCAFAGIGPGVYIASPNTLIAGEITKRVDALFKSMKLEYTVIQTRIDLNGVYVY